jgi:hypothetical protein
MTGKAIGIFLLASALVAGVAMYWLQLYAFYEELPADTVEIRLTSVESGEPESVGAVVRRAIDADSSPLRFRACLELSADPAELAGEYVPMDGAVPLTAPGWFDCYDAEALGDALSSGEARAFLSERDITDGIDRVVAVFGDGRAYAWHQLNEKYED